MDEYERLYKLYENRKDEYLEGIVNGGDEFTPEAKKVAEEILKSRGTTFLKQEGNDAISGGHSSEMQEHEGKVSIVGNLIKMIAIIFFVVAAICIVINIRLMGMFWCMISLFAAFASNLLIYGVGEVICLLTSIDSKMSKG